MSEKFNPKQGKTSKEARPVKCIYLHSAGFFLFKRYLTNPAKAETSIQKNMLKYYYANETEIPDDVPIVTTNKSLSKTNGELVEAKNTLASELTEAKNSFSSEKENLRSELESAKSKSLSSGQRAVSIEEFELAKAAKDAGFTKDSITDAKEKLEKFETEKANAEKRSAITKALEFAEVTNLDAAFDTKATDDLSIEWKTVDGEQKPYIIDDTGGQKTETLFDKTYVQNAAGYKNVAPVLFTEPENQGFQFSKETKTDPPKNEWDAIRQDVKDEQKAKHPTSNASVLAALSGQSAIN